MFDKELDASLWCILESDTERRMEIISFLKSIPEELLKSIKNVLSYTEISTDISSCYGGSITTVEGKMYAYRVYVDDQEKTLEIRQGLVNELCQVKPNSELKLVAESNYKAKDKWLGDYTTLEAGVYSKELLRSVEVEYTLVNNQEQSVVRKCDNLSRNIMNSKIDMKELPEELSFEYLNKRYVKDYPRRLIP